MDVLPTGCCIMWMLSPKSAQELHDWADFAGIEEVVPPEEMHATIMYAPRAVLEPHLYTDHILPMPVSLNHHYRPQTRVLGPPESSGCLVTTYDSEILANRFRFWRDQYGMEPSYPDYIPHVTLSYNAAIQCPHVMHRLMQVPCGLPITFDRERITNLKD